MNREVEPIERLEILIGEIDRWSDVAARDKTRAVVQAILDLHAQGLARVLEIGKRGTGIDFAAALAADDLVGSLLVLHDLHPNDIAARARAALEAIAPTLRGEGAKAELTSADGGALVVQLLRSSPSGRGDALAARVEEALWAAAPDAESIRVEEIAPLTGLVPIERLRSGGAP